MQIIAISITTLAYPFERKDSMIVSLLIFADEIIKVVRKHKTKLDRHVNPGDNQLLDNSKDVRRLKVSVLMPEAIYDLV